MSTLYDIPVNRIDGSPASLGDYRGQVLLVVNVASECGLTPQYEGLEKLYERFHEQGFAVLGFPANEFGAQEPGDNAAIADFCRTQFGVRFPMFEKIVVKGEGQHPLYHTLTSAQPQPVGTEGNPMYDRLAERGMGPQAPGDVLWNFEKFLVSRSGEVVARFAPTLTPDDPRVVEAIEAELAKG